MNGACNVKFVFGPAPWSPGDGSKGKISFNFNYKVNFTFCCLGHAPGKGLWGAGGAQGVKKKFFSNMVMWHIKSTGMTSRTECK